MRWRIDARHCDDTLTRIQNDNPLITSAPRRGGDVVNTPDPRRWWALALLCGAFFMVVLDATIVLVALPSIQADIGFSEQGLQWVLSAYALTFGGLLLLGGRAADLLGRRRLFMTGVLFFTAASLMCGLAWSPAALLRPAWSRAPAPRS